MVDCAVPIDPSRCPVCGQDNRCAMEEQKRTGQAQPPCWCTRVEFSVELLSRVPDAAQGKACICPACAASQPAAELPADHRTKAARTRVSSP